MRRFSWKHLLIFILVFTLCSELIWEVAPLFDDATSFTFSASKTGQNLIVNYSAHANTMLDLRVLLIPVIEKPAIDVAVYVYYDPSYPAVGTLWDYVHMLWSNLQREMFLRGVKGKISLVSARDLEGIMSNKEKVVIIMGSGSLPSNVFSRDKNLVTPWLDSGGVLLWFGWPPGYYSVNEGQIINSTTFWALPQNLHEEGVNLIGLGDVIQIKPYPANGTLETAENSSYFSDLLDINYNIIQYGLLADPVSQEGFILGGIGGNPSKSSVSVVSVGMGKIVVFGFFVLGSYILNGPELSARDVAQILDSGIIYASESLAPAYKEHRLSVGESLNDQITLETNSSIKGIVVYAYSTITSNAFLFHSEFIPNN